VNVVHVFPYSPRISGGHSNAIRAFIESQKLAGVQAMAVAPKFDGPPSDAKFSFPLMEVDSLWTLRWETIARQFGLAAEETVFNFHSVNHRLAPFQRDLKQAGVPYVLTSHGQLGIQTFARWLKKFVYLSLVDHGPRHAAGLHVLTSVVANQLKFVLPGYRGSVLIQGNLITLPDSINLRAGNRSEYGIPPDCCVLLYLGRMDVDIKGLDLIVEAMSFLPPSQFCLVLAGPDWQNGKARLENLARQLGCRDQIRFIGPVYGDKKWELLQLADIFVSPSRREAFSVALAEAMACGLPVVTSTQVNLAPDLMSDGTALVCPLNAESLADAIMTLDTDRDGRLTLGNNGRAWVAVNCNPHRAGERFRDFYRAILDKQKARPQPNQPSPLPAS